MLDCLLALYLPHAAVLFPHFIIILILSTLDAHLLPDATLWMRGGLSSVATVYALSPSHAALIANVNLWVWAFCWQLFKVRISLQ